MTLTPPEASPMLHPNMWLLGWQPSFLVFLLKNNHSHRVCKTHLATTTTNNHIVGLGTSGSRRSCFRAGVGLGSVQPQKSHLERGKSRTTTPSPALGLHVPAPSIFAHTRGGNQVQTRLNFPSPYKVMSSKCLEFLVMQIRHPQHPGPNQWCTPTPTVPTHPQRFKKPLFHSSN